MTFRVIILPQAHRDIDRNADWWAENDEFPYEIRDKLIGLGSRPNYRDVFTVKGDTVYVLTVRRGAQDVLRPSDVESLPELALETRFGRPLWTIAFFITRRSPDFATGQTA